MNIILVRQVNGLPRSITLRRPSLIALVIGALAAFVAAGVFYTGYLSGAVFAQAAPVEPVDDSLSDLEGLAAIRDLRAEQSMIDRQRRQLQSELDAISSYVGRLQGRMERLDAFGERLVAAAGLDAEAFDFFAAAPVGGPLSAEDALSLSGAELGEVLRAFSAGLEHRERRLQLMEAMIGAQTLDRDLTLRGRPVEGGWMSSRYGWRIDPITGKKALHRGLDFAAAKGAEIYAVAAGIVAFAGSRGSYGNIVEIDHGNGYASRYAHNKRNLVRDGDVVKRGDVIALLGNTGRSKGAHVHFEVLRGGKNVDPLPFVRAGNQARVSP